MLGLAFLYATCKFAHKSYFYWKKLSAEREDEKLMEEKIIIQWIRMNQICRS